MRSERTVQKVLYKNPSTHDSYYYRPWEPPPPKLILISTPITSVNQSSAYFLFPLSSSTGAPLLVNCFFSLLCLHPACVLNEQTSIRPRICPSAAACYCIHTCSTCHHLHRTLSICAFDELSWLVSILSSIAPQDVRCNGQTSISQFPPRRRQVPILSSVPLPNSQLEPIWSSVPPLPSLRLLAVLPCQSHCSFLLHVVPDGVADLMRSWSR